MLTSFPLISTLARVAKHSQMPRVKWMFSLTLLCISLQARMVEAQLHNFEPSIMRNSLTRCPLYFPQQMECYLCLIICRYSQISILSTSRCCWPFLRLSKTLMHKWLPLSKLWTDLMINSIVFRHVLLRVFNIIFWAQFHVSRPWI